ncbi:UNVERIFIED_CONTAM: hypothetical protein GTU68_053142, partial [Idotea baltica]|nr:hypothetical protein [Idotea baltica]
MQQNATLQAQSPRSSKTQACVSLLPSVFTCPKHKQASSTKFTPSALSMTSYANSWHPRQSLLRFWKAKMR